MGIFQWKWADVPLYGKIRKMSDKNGTTGLANVILSSTSEFPPGMHKVHLCAHKPCKEIASSVASMAGVIGAPLHLFAIDSGIATRNIPQSRNSVEKAAECAAMLKAEYSAVAKPWPPAPITAPKRKTPEEYVRSCVGLTASEIAWKQLNDRLQLDNNDDESKNDKKAKKPKNDKNDKEEEVEATLQDGYWVDARPASQPCLVHMAMEIAEAEAMEIAEARAEALAEIIR